MSVLVKGMKMPKNCLHCDFDDSYGICACRNEAPYVCEYSAKQRPSWCPLEEVPSAQPEPCGDVVSRNAIVQKLNEMDRYVSTELRLCDTDKKFPQNEVFIVDDVYEEIVEQLPSAQPEMIKEIRKWINSGNRGNADYFIVEKIEEIINKYE